MRGLEVYLHAETKHVVGAVELVEAVVTPTAHGCTYSSEHCFGSSGLGSYHAETGGSRCTLLGSGVGVGQDALLILGIGSEGGGSILRS